ncbi:MAG: tetratricopeptide repeat protein [Planctomycetia bacterium]|nr:tetratricopeptide repeat protein [Planctomycetia bacterium]
MAAACYFEQPATFVEGAEPVVPKATAETPDMLEQRGSDHFRASRFTASVADFDQEIKLDPRRAPWHWKRGISLYYAGRYADGAKQFEGYQTVDGNDVENAVWRFLCQARDPNVGLEKARREMLTIKDDRRVPMTQIYALYHGDLKPDDVVAAAKLGNPPESVLAQRLFYAHLYLGLYFEVLGDLPAAKLQMKEAVARKIDHYMGDVAVVHEKLLAAKTAK